MKKLFFTAMLLYTFSIGFAQKNVLVEELTGTWCQWCPRGIYYGDSLCGTHDNLIFVAIHSSDPMANDEYYNASGLLGAPSANIGRHFLAQETQNWFSKVEQESQVTPKVNMGITCDYDPATRQLTAHVSATALENMSGDYRFAAILTEDGVTGPAPSYNQTNSYSGGGYGPMGGYENLPNPIPAERIAYDHVGRQLLCDYGGVQGSFPSSLPSGQTASYEFTYTLDENYDYNYVRVIGLLIAPDGTVENAVKSPYLNGEETAAPLFTSTPKTESYANLNYLYNVYFHDPDPADYVNITLLQAPSWLTLEQYDGESACLYGIPDQPGSYEVRLELSECIHSTIQDFTIIVDEPLSGSWEYVGPRGFSQNAFQVFGIKMDNERNLYVFGNENSTPVLYKNAAGTDTWEQMGSISTSCSVSAGGMDLASNGDVYVAYSDQSDNGYAFKWDGSQWTPIGSAFSSVETHIVLDNNDLPYLVARDVSQGYKGVVFKLENGSWVPVSGTGIYVPDAEYACHQELVFDS
ncbi:MAG: Omp28-related outer membrane protein, partial [Bacteroidales bacterium]|nr:Omp28-related outer membrane protein [Bacteroidales bacterium]